MLIGEIVGAIQKMYEQEFEKGNNQDSGVMQVLKSWVGLTNDMIHPECHVWTETLNVFKQLIPIVQEYLEATPAVEVHARKLMSYTEPYVAVLLHRLFQHNLEPKELKELGKAGKLSQINWTVRNSQELQKIKLPDTTLLMVVASYIASYTSSSEDITHFTNQKTKSKRSRKKGKHAVE